MYENKAEASGSIETLNSLLAGEISAIESYNQAIDKLGPKYENLELDQLRQEHSRRAQKLRDRVTQLGGAPKMNSGIWGAFAQAVAGGGALIGAVPAIAALEEGEDRGLVDYKKALEKLDPQSQELILNDLLPGQEHTHSIMRMMKKNLSS